jgi:hypothetical protein
LFVEFFSENFFVDERLEKEAFSLFSFLTVFGIKEAAGL